MSTQVVIGFVRARAPWPTNASNSASCSGVASSGRQPEAALAARRQSLGHRRAHRRRDRLLVELLRLPRREPALLDRGPGAAVLGRELLRVPGRVAGTLERADRDVRWIADVVGVAVAAELVVGRHDVAAGSAGRATRAGRSPRRGRPARTSRGSLFPAGPSCPSRGSPGCPTRSRRGRPSRPRARRIRISPSRRWLSGVSISGTTISPCSPRVHVTSTTRWPSATALAIAPPVPIVSSSGWAWTVMRIEAVVVGSGAVVGPRGRCRSCPRRIPDAPRSGPRPLGRRPNPLDEGAVETVYARDVHDLPVLRHREPGGREVLQRVRDAAREHVPELRDRSNATGRQVLQRVRHAARAAGTPTAGRGAAEAPAATEPVVGPASTERRLVSVLFADLVGFTSARRRTATPRTSASC